MAQNGRHYKESGLTVNLADLQESEMGQKGAEFISDTAAHTPGDGYVFSALQIVDDAILSAYAPALTGDTFTGVTLVTGLVVYGRFTSVTLTSGKVIAYRGI